MGSRTLCTYKNNCEVIYYITIENVDMSSLKQLYKKLRLKIQEYQSNDKQDWVNQFLRIIQTDIFDEDFISDIIDCKNIEIDKNIKQDIIAKKL